MKIVSLTNATSVVHPVHGTATVGADGTFELGAEFAAELLRYTTLWATQTEHLAEAASIDMSELYDPAHSATVLALAREDVALLRAGAVPEPVAVDPAAPWEPDAATVAWIGMHLRGDAAGIAEFSALALERAVLHQRAAAPAATEAQAKAAKSSQSAPEVAA